MTLTERRQNYRIYTMWLVITSCQETAEVCKSQYNGQPPTLSTEINVNTVRTLIEEDCSLTCQVMVAIMDCPVDDRKHYEKTRYAARCFDVGLASFKRRATSTTF